MHHEIAIIGGGPSGSTAAIYLAECGYDVCLIEKKIFPREILCGEFLSREVVNNLKELNLFSGFLTLKPNQINSFAMFEDKKGISTQLDFPQSRTVKAYGVYFGTDKLVHFHHLGADYYRMYRSLIQSGSSAEAAYRKVVEHFAQTGVWSEKALFGRLTTGIYSNADLAANHLGFKFFVNRTEKVVLKGKEQEPLIVRSGVFWRLIRQVRSGSGWFRAYISDHWNEALNPNRYDGSMRPGIRRVLQKRANTIVEFYTQRDGRPEDPAYFDNLARELSTYYGEPYGHCGQIEIIIFSLGLVPTRLK